MVKMIRSFWFFALCVICGPVLAHAQFLGFTSPQTVGPITCINAAIAPTTSSATPGAASFIPNLGQSVHYLTWLTLGNITFSIQLDGGFNNSTWFRISETGTVRGSGAIWANVYYPFIRCNLTVASGGGSISATYTGTSVTAGPPAGIFNSSGIFTKDLARSAMANANALYSTSLPTGSSGGTIYIVNSGGFSAGGALTLKAGIDSSHLASVNVFEISSGTAQQVLPVSPIAAAYAELSYTAPAGQAANTYDLAYSFSLNSSTSTASTILLAPAGVSMFLCAANGVVSLSGAGNTQIIPAVAGLTIRVCHLSLSFVSMVDFELHSGTGVNCATGDTAITGTYQDVLTFAPPFTSLSPLTVGTGLALCANLGTAVTGGGLVIYAQF